MKRFFSIIMVLIAICAPKSGRAQSFADRLHFELAAGTGTKNKGIEPFDLSAKVGVDIIPHLYAFASAEGNLALSENNDVRTWYKSQSLGGGIGAQLWTKNQSADALDLRLKVLTSLGGSDWKRTTYDVSVAWYLQSSKKRIFTPVAEIGYRYVNSRTIGLDNTSSFYVSLGFRF